jgi:PPOX class probable F420-dependent enzyme
VTLIDTHTAFGGRVAAHLRDEVVVWFTTVAPGGTPQPSPVWFLWDGAEEVVVYSKESQRTTNLAANPRVSLNFRGDELGGDIVILSGEARIDPAAPPADQVPEYVAKYAEHIAQLRSTPSEFAADYHVCVRISLTRLRGF